MPRIFILGIVASGKTTLAKKLSSKLNIPYYEGDCIVWNKTEKGRYKRTKEEQHEVINKIDKKGNWIIEGTYRESYSCLLDLADKIIFLDTSLWKRRYRIVARFIKQQLHIEKCHYKPDINMLKLMFKWTKDFENNRIGFEKILKGYQEKLLTVRTSKDINNLLKRDENGL